jgi:hypothetical protein
MQARAIFELEEPTVEGDAILMSLSVSLSKYCPGFSRISVLARYHVPLTQCRMATGIVDTAALADAEIKQDPQLDMCILLSPRAVSAANRIIPATICVIRNRERVMGARVHMIQDVTTKSETERLVRPEILRAHEHLFGVCGPSTHDDAFADIIVQAIEDCYRNAYKFVAVGAAQ